MDGPEPPGSDVLITRFALGRVEEESKPEVLLVGDKYFEGPTRWTTETGPPAVAIEELVTSEAALVGRCIWFTVDDEDSAGGEQELLS